MTKQVISYEVKTTLGQHRGAPRFWQEGQQLLRAGFEPDTRYTATVDKENKRIVLSVMDAGQRKVSKKTVGGKEIPVIDINSREILEVFDGYDSVRVIMRERQIYILPAIVDVKRKERLDRLEAKMANNEPISVGSVASGIGVLSNALHHGMQKHVQAKVAFANELRGEFLDQGAVNNEAWTTQTAMIAAPMQDLAMDPWTLKQLGPVDVLEGGIPCSGASVAGRAKRGTECAEEHPLVGHLVVPFIQLIQAVNPLVVILENVKPYQSSASMWILRHSLRDLGYDVHETILQAAEFNELEHRERMCMVAVTKGMEFSFDELQKPAPVQRKLGEVLDVLAEDDPSWSGFDYLKRHEEKHAAKGNGFKMQIFDTESDHIGTITKGYAKIRSTDPKIAHPSNPELMRQVTPEEHARCKGIPSHLVTGMGKTAAHEALGQSICYSPFAAVGELVGRTLRKPINHSVKTEVQDLLTAA